MGVALYPNHGNTMGLLIRAADEALYQAKAHGRDRVILAATHPIPASQSRNDGSLAPA
jgi:PleD family two-component response regulator